MGKNDMKIGKVSGSVLERSVLRQIVTNRDKILSGAGVGADCAIFSFGSGQNLVSCVQEAVIALPEEDVSRNDAAGAYGRTDCVVRDKMWEGDLGQERDVSGMSMDRVMRRSVTEPGMTLGQLIQKCANNLAAGGAKPEAILLTLFLPEDVEEAGLKALMAEARIKCQELSLELAGGQSRVTSMAGAPLAVVTGYGRPYGGEVHTVNRAAPGQDILISKWIGLQGTAILAKRYRQKLLGRYPAYLVEEAMGFERYQSIIPEAEAAVKSGVCAMHDASEGGIFGALWELAQGAGVGLKIDLRKLPLRQETVEVCECCNANPYELLSGGCLIMTTHNGQGLLAALEEERIPAVIVGRVTEGKSRILSNGEEIRFLDRPKQDQIYM